MSTPDTNAQGRGVLLFYERFAKEHGLTVSLLHVLEAVHAAPGCTQSALCAQLRLSKQRTHVLVSTAQEQGLLTKSKNEKDSRSVLLRLTPRGEALMGEFGSAAAHGGAPAGYHAHTDENGAVYYHTHGTHGHTHPHENTKAVLDRLSRAIGHLEKVRQMIEAGEDCSDVLVQLSAVKAAVNNTGKLILKDHISHCLVDAVEHGDSKSLENLNAAIDQFIK